MSFRLFNAMRKCRIVPVKNQSDADYVSSCWDKGIREGCLHGTPGEIKGIITQMLQKKDHRAEVAILTLGKRDYWYFYVLYYKQKKIGTVIVSYDQNSEHAEFLFIYIDDSMRNKGLGSVFQKMIEVEIIKEIPSLKEFQIRCFATSLAGQRIAEKSGYNCISISPSGIKDYRKRT